MTRYVGLFLFGAGVALASWAQFHLGQFFRGYLTLQENWCPLLPLGSGQTRLLRVRITPGEPGDGPKITGSPAQAITAQS